jgi:hypothetical protein
MTKTTLENKVLILAEIWDTEQKPWNGTTDWLLFINKWSVSLPICYLLREEIVDVKPELESEIAAGIDNCFSGLLETLEIEEDTGFETFSDVIEVAPVGYYS